MHSTERRILGTLLALSVVLNLALALELRGSRATSRGRNPILGTFVPPPDVEDLAGRQTRIAFDSKLETVFYILSPACGWCDRNVENVKALAAASSGRFRLVGISTTTEGLERALQEQQLPFPVYRNPSPATVAAYKIGATPRTIVVSRLGQVVKVWDGAFGGALKRDIERYYRISLPGYARESSASSK